MDGLYEQIRIALHQVWQRRWLALAVAWGIALVGWAVVSVLPSSYEAKARLFVQLQSVLPSDGGAAPASAQNDLLRLKQTLTSNENLTRVVRRTELNSLVTSDADLGSIIAGLRERIKITAQPDNIVEISATSNLRGLSNGQNARASAAVVEQLVQIFQNGGAAGDTAANGQSLTFLDQELARREAQLREAEQSRVTFEQAHPGLSAGAGGTDSRMAQNRTEMAQLDQTIIAAQSALNAMRTQLASTPQTMPNASGVVGGPAATQIAALESQLQGYRTRGFTDAYPDVITTRQQIERLRPIAARESRGGQAQGLPNPSYTSLQAMIAEREGALAGAQARRAQLQGDLAQLGTAAAGEPQAQAQLQTMNRDYDVLRQQYERLLADREQLRLRSDIQAQANPMTVRVVEPPRVPSTPASPNRPLFLALVLVVAIGAGLAVAFFKGQLQTTFPTPNKLAEATGLPVLGAIAEQLDKAARARRRKKLFYLACASGALAGCFALLMAVEFWQRGNMA